MAATRAIRCRPRRSVWLWLPCWRRGNRVSVTVLAADDRAGDDAVGSPRPKGDEKPALAGQQHPCPPRPRSWIDSLPGSGFPARALAAARMTGGRPADPLVVALAADCATSRPSSSTSSLPRSERSDGTLIRDRHDSSRHPDHGRGLKSSALARGQRHPAGLMRRGPPDRRRWRLTAGAIWLLRDQENWPPGSAWLSWRWWRFTRRWCQVLQRPSRLA